MWEGDSGEREGGACNRTQGVHARGSLGTPALPVLIIRVAREMLTTRKEGGPDRQVRRGPGTFSHFLLLSLS